MKTNHQLKSNSKAKFIRSRFAASVWMSALLAGLSTILLPTSGYAQAACTRAALNGSCVVRNVATGGGGARISDQIEITVVAAGTSAGICPKSNGIMFLTH